MTFYILHTLTIPHIFTKLKICNKVLNKFNFMFQFYGLKINKSKCEVARTGVMKGVKVTLCGAECVNLLTNAIKILGTFSQIIRS